MFTGGEAVNHALLVNIGAILVELVLTFDPPDGNFKGNNGLELLLEIVLRQIHLPFWFAPPLMVFYQVVQQATHRRIILDNLRHTVDVYRSVIPGGHTRLILVPAWRNVSVGTLEHHQRLLTVETFPLTVGT